MPDRIVVRRFRYDLRHAFGICSVTRLCSTFPSKNKQTSKNPDCLLAHLTYFRKKADRILADA